MQLGQAIDQRLIFIRPVAHRDRERKTMLLVPEKHLSDKQNRTVGIGLTSSAIRSYGPLLTFGWCGREIRVSPSGFREPDWLFGIRQLPGGLSNC